MSVSEKMYDITFKRRDKGPDEVQRYGDLSEARGIMKLLTNSPGKEPYERIILSEYDRRTKRQRIYDVLDFQPKDMQRDWRKWSIGRYTEYKYKDFDGAGVLHGLITETADDHAVMEVEGMVLRIDDENADMFS